MKYAGLAAAIALAWIAANPVFAAAGSRAGREGDATATSTPIKYLVVIFDENNSFDHYFGSYPIAANPPGEPQFVAAPGTPTVNGLTPGLIADNPNSTKPFRLDRSQASTCDNINHYTNEQEAYDGGLLDLFPEHTSSTDAGCPAGLAMGYYDGNTVTALWNYAQNYAMSDNFFATEFGTTVMGHINLISGQTHQDNVQTISGKVANGSIIGNLDPEFDDCSHGSVLAMSGKNVGDLLNAANATWGWFYGDFAPASMSAGGVAACSAQYDGHYDPFQYYQSTANPHHLPPSSVSAIGYTDQANHQYDLSAFWAALGAGNLPSVSFLKAPRNQTGHPSDSTPLEEQTFLVDTINRLEDSPEWKQMAIVITYDDSDGWYDHVMPPIVNQSDDPDHDALLGSRLCGSAAPNAYEDRCGYGPRLPFVVISPFARQNFVDHTLNDQTSVLRFIEDNWGLGRIGDQSFDAKAGSIQGVFDFGHPRNRVLILNPGTGEPGPGRSD